MNIKVSVQEAEEILSGYFYDKLNAAEHIRVDIQLPELKEVIRNYVPITADALHKLATCLPNDGNKITAIKFIREATPGLGIAPAKQIVEEVMNKGKGVYESCNSPDAIQRWLSVTSF